MGFTITDKQVKRAGLDYWDKLDITFYDSQEEFFEKNKGADFYYFSTKAERLPMRGIIRSLNLSNAVAIGTYEVLRQWGYPALSQKGKLTKYDW